MTSRRRVPDEVMVLADGSIQPDLFGATDAELARRAHAERVREQFEGRARTLPGGAAVVWVAPYDTIGARTGERRPGWRCWLCGGVEANEYVLGLRHGLHAGDPEVLTRTRCRLQDRMQDRDTDGAMGGPR